MTGCSKIGLENNLQKTRLDLPIYLSIYLESIVELVVVVWKNDPLPRSPPIKQAVKQSGLDHQESSDMFINVWEMEMIEFSGDDFSHFPSRHLRVASYF